MLNEKNEKNIVPHTKTHRNYSRTSYASDLSYGDFVISRYYIHFYIEYPKTVSNLEWSLDETAIGSYAE